MPNDQQLLVVLLPEHGQIGPHQVEQLRHDHGDPGEVPGTERAAQHVAQSRHDHLCVPLGAVRIQLLSRGGEQEIAAVLPKPDRIRLQRARVGAEILGRSELGRVHEHAGHHPAGALAGQPYQGVVPVVQVAHRGDEADLVPAPAQLRDRGAELQHGMDGAHDVGVQYACAAVGNSPRLT